MWTFHSCWMLVMLGICRSLITFSLSVSLWDTILSVWLKCKIQIAYSAVTIDISCTHHATMDTKSSYFFPLSSAVTVSIRSSFFDQLMTEEIQQNRGRWNCVEIVNSLLSLVTPLTNGRDTYSRRPTVDRKPRWYDQSRPRGPKNCHRTHQKDEGRQDVIHLHNSRRR